MRTIIVTSMRIVPTFASAVLAAALAAPLASPAVAAPAPDHHRSIGSRGWFVVADPAVSALYVVDARTGQRTGTLRDVELGSHAGTVQLGDGRLGFVDESGPSFDVLRISRHGRPKIEESFPIPARAGEWNRAGWISTDPAHRYVAVGSDKDDSTTQQVTVVDLRRDKARTAVLTTHEVTLATTGETGTEEMETYLVGSPLRLVVTAGGRLEAYDVRAILRGDRRPEVVASTKLGAYPHGPVVAADGSALGTTLHDGIQTVRVRGDRLRGSADVDYRPGVVQAYRPRMAADGTTYASTQAGDPAGPAYLLSGSLASGRLQTVRIGDGVASRVALGADRAVATVSSASGTVLVEVAARRGSGLFGGRVTSIDLAALASGATAARAVAVSADGRHALVTRNGEGTFDLVNLATDRVRSALALPSPLSGGGYVTAVDPAAAPADLIGR
jgi:hypothetical protein